jgi:hypothetical protein
VAGCRDYTNELSGSVKCRGYVGRLGESHLSGFETVTTVLMKIQVCGMSLGGEGNCITGTLRSKPQVLNLDFFSERHLFVRRKRAQRSQK